MTYSDSKRRRTRSSGDSYNWDAHHRATSKASFDKVKRAADPFEYLKALKDAELLDVYNNTIGISRYGDTDWNRIVVLLGGDELALIIKKIEDAKQRRRDESAKRQEAHTANIIARKQDMACESRLVAGYLQTEIASAIQWKEKHGRIDGDWLDDPIGAITGVGGFGEEVRTSTGIKMVVNLCLDCSNSMRHNGLADICIEATRNLYLALSESSQGLPDGSLKVNYWLWAKGTDGKYVRQLTGAITENNPLGAVDNLVGWMFDGEDTWIHPLLEQLEDWEEKNADQGSYRLDLIMSDGVLEHPTDRSKADVIQERRGDHGVLDTVMLNFLPIVDWGDFKVPNRCVQYHVDIDNLFSMLRQLLGDWLVRIA